MGSLGGNPLANSLVLSPYPGRQSVDLGLFRAMDLQITH